ncbi:MAG: hypothetical protein WCK37_00345 [Candidatus Falkowbacteria bacterium]
MSTLKITGSRKPININYVDFAQGSKNAALPVFGASLLFNGQLLIDNVPNISDVQNIFKLLREINVSFGYDNNAFIKLATNKINPAEITLSADFFKTRGGFYLVAALINKCRKIKIKKYSIAGCRIGVRAYDNILRVFNVFGFQIKIVAGDIIIKKKRDYYGEKISLNDLGICASGVALILAAQFKVKTNLVGSSKAPELNDLINFLRSNGIAIKRYQNSDLLVYKNNSAWPCNSFKIQDDRIVIATYAILALLSGGYFKIKTSKLKYLDSFIKFLRDSGCIIWNGLEDGVTIFLPGKKMRANDLVVDDYPKIPTDIQPILTVFLCALKGRATICDLIFPERNFHVKQLQRMGQNIKNRDGQIVINGNNKFIAGKVRGHDLRCGAALILAACVARGTSEISDWEYVGRGYEKLLDIVVQNRRLIIV